MVTSDVTLNPEILCEYIVLTQGTGTIDSTDFCLFRNDRSGGLRGSSEESQQQTGRVRASIYRRPNYIHTRPSRK